MFRVIVCHGHQTGHDDHIEDPLDQVVQEATLHFLSLCGRAAPFQLETCVVILAKLFPAEVSEPFWIKFLTDVKSGRDDQEHEDCIPPRARDDYCQGEKFEGSVGEKQDEDQFCEV